MASTFVRASSVCTSCGASMGSSASPASASGCWQRQRVVESSKIGQPGAELRPQRTTTSGRWIAKPMGAGGAGSGLRGIWSGAKIQWEGRGGSNRDQGRWNLEHRRRSVVCAAGDDVSQELANRPSFDSFLSSFVAVSVESEVSTSSGSVGTIDVDSGSMLVLEQGQRGEANQEPPTLPPFASQTPEGQTIIKEQENAREADALLQRAASVLGEVDNLLKEMPSNFNVDTERDKLLSGIDALKSRLNISEASPAVGKGSSTEQQTPRPRTGKRQPQSDELKGPKAQSLVDVIREQATSPTSKEVPPPRPPSRSGLEPPGNTTYRLADDSTSPPSPRAETVARAGPAPPAAPASSPAVGQSLTAGPGKKESNATIQDTGPARAVSSVSSSSPSNASNPTSSISRDSTTGRASSARSPADFPPRSSTPAPAEKSRVGVSGGATGRSQSIDSARPPPSSATKVDSIPLTAGTKSAQAERTTGKNASIVSPPGDGYGAAQIPGSLTSTPPSSSSSTAAPPPAAAPSLSGSGAVGSASVTGVSNSTAGYRDGSFGSSWTTFTDKNLRAPPGDSQSASPLANPSSPSSSGSGAAPGNRVDGQTSVKRASPARPPAESADGFDDDLGIDVLSGQPNKPSAGPRAPNAGGGGGGGIRVGGVEMPKAVDNVGGKRFANPVFNQSSTPWADGLKLQPASSPKASANLAYADPPPQIALPPLLSVLEKSQAQADAESIVAADGTLKLPLQSVVEMTTAWKPPTRTDAVPEEPEMAVEGQPREAHDTRQTLISMEERWGEDMGFGEFSGVAADGTQWWRASGEEFGENGLRVRWTLLRGVSNGIEWEETWWEKADWLGFKELGARKSGSDAEGGAWKEEWREAIRQDADTGLTRVEKSAHKWAKNGAGEEWEEKWDENYDARGKVKKSAEKWGKEPGKVWHERWGEEWDGLGAMVKWADRWAEKDYYGGGGKEEWGEKWEERFGWGGEGKRHGESWTKGTGREAYWRSWAEDHHGNGYVRKHGNSTTGEYWDTTEQMDTWYEKKSHYGFKEAYDNTHVLRQIKLRKRRAF